MGIVTAWPGSDDNVVELHLVYARMLTTYPALAVGLALGILSISSVFRVTTLGELSPQSIATVSG